MVRVAAGLAALDDQSCTQARKEEVTLDATAFAIAYVIGRWEALEADRQKDAAQ